MRRGAPRFLSYVLVSVFSLTLSAQDSDVSSPLAERITKLNQELLGTLPESGRAFSLQSSDNQLRSLIEQRREALEELVGLDAAKALALALPEEQLKRLRLAYPELAGELESRGEWQGTIEYWIADDFESGTSWPVYRLDLEPEGVEVSFGSSEPPGLATGELVRVRGLKIGPRVAASESFIVAPAEETIRCPTTGEQRIAVIMVAYPNEPVPDVSPQEIRDVFFSSSQASLAGFWREASYGRTYATGDVFGWFTLPKAYSCEFSTRETEIFDGLSGAAIAAADEQVDFTEYNRIFIIAPWKEGCLFAWAADRCRTLTAPSDGTFTASQSFVFTENTAHFRLVKLAAHEGGHNMGLGHASSLDFGDITLGFAGETGTHLETGDFFSTMGIANGHYSARHKFQLGWLENGTEIETVEESGVFTLSPLSSSVAGLKALRVRRAAGSDEWLWVEYRQPIGPYDSTGPKQGFLGALIHYEGPLNKGEWGDLGRVDPQKGRYAGQTHILDLTPQSRETENGGILTQDHLDWSDPALAVGETWEGVFSSLTIEALTRTSDSLTISVRREASCVSLSPDSREHGPEAATGTVSISAAPSCSWEARASEPWITITSALSGSGSGELEYSIGRNEEFETRDGAVIVDLLGFRIAQAAGLAAPTADSVSPSSGSGPTGEFFFNYSDLNGTDDLSVLAANINTSPTAVGGCALEHDRANLTVRLADDAGTGWLGPVPIGQAGGLGNSRCRVDFAKAGESLAGYSVHVGLIFSPSFVGEKRVFLYAEDQAGLNSGWQNQGSWSVTANDPPRFISVIPGSGEGYNQIFSVLTYDANGADDLFLIYLVFGSVDGPSHCEVMVQLPDGDFLLRADEGGDRIRPEEGRLQNSSCSLNLGTSSTTKDGTETRVSFDLTFKAAFDGPKTIRGRTSYRSDDATSRSIALGTWTVGPGLKPPFTSAGLVHSARLEAGDVAEQEIVSLFGLSLADFDADAVLPLGTELGGASVDVTDSQGVTRPCLMFAARVETDVSSAQLNFIIAAGTATGPAILTVRRASGGSHSIPINVVEVAPGIFTANSSGSGVPAANALRFVDGQLTGTSLVFDVTAFPFQATPIDLGPANHQVFLSLFATGIRNGSTVDVTIDGVPMTTIFGPAPSSEFEGIGPAQRTP